MGSQYAQGMVIEHLKLSPTQIKKYIGDINTAVFRSSWELMFIRFLFYSESVIAINSEDVVVNYISPIDGKWHRYFIDFYFRYIAKGGRVENVLIEMKPFSQIRQPVPTKNMDMCKFEKQLARYAVNKAKWLAAKDYSDRNDAKFFVVTEDPTKKTLSFKLHAFEELNICKG